MLLAMIVGSGVLSEMNLRRIKVYRKALRGVFAGTPAVIALEIEVGKRLFAAYSLTVQDQVASGAPPPGCYSLRIGVGKRSSTSYSYRFPRRGRWTLGPLKASTRFPFGLFEKSRRIRVEAQLLVYPKLVPVGPAAIEASGQGDASSLRRGRAGEFHSLRQAQEGDELRDICWRKSAQTGRLVVRQNEDPTSRQVVVVLDNRALAARPSAEQLQAQEAAVSRAASLALHYLNCGYAVGLVTRGDCLPLGVGRRHLEAIMGNLALVDFVGDDQALRVPASMGGQRLHVRADAMPEMARAA